MLVIFLVENTCRYSNIFQCIYIYTCIYIFFFFIFLYILYIYIFLPAAFGLFGLLAEPALDQHCGMLHLKENQKESTPESYTTTKYTVPKKGRQFHQEGASSMAQRAGSTKRTMDTDSGEPRPKMARRTARSD